MSVPELITSLVGDWRGTSTLVRPWQAPAESESPSTARVLLPLGGRFARIDYTWAADGTPHEGSLLIGTEKNGDVAEVAWVDSWHQSEKIMLATGTMTRSGGFDVFAKYPAPPDPDWGWRTILRPAGGSGWELVMYNVTPGGEETLAFRNIYSRA